MGEWILTALALLGLSHNATAPQSSGSTASPTQTPTASPTDPSGTGSGGSGTTDGKHYPPG